MNSAVHVLTVITPHARAETADKRRTVIEEESSRLSQFLEELEAPGDRDETPNSRGRR